MPIRIPPESSWCRLHLILLQDSTPQLKQGASIMEVERRTRVQSFHFRERYLRDSQKISYVLPGAELRQSLDTLWTHSFHSASSRFLIHDFVNCAEYQIFSMYSSTWRFHPTTKGHVHGCGVISIANARFSS
jgi:hypothetical protein